MSELSIFIDESGDFGEYDPDCPFYLIVLVFHDQSKSITKEIGELRKHVIEQGFPANHAVHTAPLVRREKKYKSLDWPQRRKLFRHIFDFTRFCEISYVAFAFERKELKQPQELVDRMSQEIRGFVRDNLRFFQGYDRIVVYYDNGQKEISRIINEAINTVLAAETKTAYPSEYCLLQAADLICTLELARAKVDKKGYSLSPSEEYFFTSERKLKKNYLKPLLKKRFQ